MIRDYLRLDKISERIYVNTEGKSGGNVGIVVTRNRVIAIDAQYPVSGTDFRKSIGELTKKRVSHLLLTHVHGDHVFGNQAFEDTEIVSHWKLKEKMEENLSTIWKPEGIRKMVEDLRKTQPDRALLFDGIRIVLPKTTFKRSYMVGDVSLVYTGGHTDCSSYVYVSEDKVLFAGDNLFVGRFPWAGDPTANPDLWIRALQHYVKLDVEKIVPGHGPVCDKSEVERQIVWFRGVRRRMKKLIKDGASEDEAIKSDYPTLYPSDRPEWAENSLRRWFRHWRA